MPICSVWYMLLEICMPWTHSEMLCKQAISQACTLAINPSCVPLVPFTFPTLWHSCELTLSLLWKHRLVDTIMLFETYCSQCKTYCCFVSNHKWMKQNKSRKWTPVSFRCRGSCKFDDCPVQFCVEINSQDPSKQFEVLVTFTSNLVKHKRSERRSRQCYWTEKRGHGKITKPAVSINCL